MLVFYNGLQRTLLEERLARKQADKGMDPERDEEMTLRLTRGFLDFLLSNPQR